MALGQNHFKEAQELFKEAVEKDPGNAVVSLNQTILIEKPFSFRSNTITTIFGSRNLGDLTALETGFKAVK